MNKAKRNAGLAIAALVVSLAFGEVAVRVFARAGPADEPGNYLIPHPLWNHWHGPDVRGVVGDPWYDFPPHEVRTNVWGMRDSRFFSQSKPAGVFRLLLLGDSFAEATEVPEEAGVARRIEERLRMRRGGKVEVLNLGCASFSPVLEYMVLRDVGLAFEPDAVVLLHHVTDVTDDWSYLTEGAQFDEDGRLERVRATRAEAPAERPLALTLARRSRLLVWLARRARARGWLGPGQTPDDDPPITRSWTGVLRERYSPDDERAWDASLRALGWIAELCGRRRLPLLVVAVPLAQQVEPVAAAGLLPLPQTAGTGGPDRYQAELLSRTRDLGAKVVDLRKAFREQRRTRPAERLYWPRNQHWTGAGHALAGRVIADEVAALAVLDAPRSR